MTDERKRIKPSQKCPACRAYVAAQELAANAGKCGQCAQVARIRAKIAGILESEAKSGR